MAYDFRTPRNHLNKGVWCFTIYPSYDPVECLAGVGTLDADRLKKQYGVETVSDLAGLNMWDCKRDGDWLLVQQARAYVKRFFEEIR